MEKAAGQTLIFSVSIRSFLTYLEQGCQKSRSRILMYRKECLSIRKDPQVFPLHHGNAAKVIDSLGINE